LFARGSARRAIAVYAAAREERPIVCSRARARSVRLDRALEAPSRYLEGSKRSAMTHHQRLILVWTVSLGCTPAPATSDTSDSQGETSDETGADTRSDDESSSGST